MALTQYTLPTIVGPAGTFTVDLFSSIAGLTIPSKQSFLDIGQSEEVADVKMGITQASRVNISLADDYSTYSEGFWYKVLNGTMQLRIYLNQGAGNTFYFYGAPQPETITWNEKYISGSTRVRFVNFDLTSAAYVILDMLTTTWVDAVVANSVNIGRTDDAEPSFLIKPQGLFAAMLSASGLNPTYSIADVSFVYNSGPDFKWLVSPSFYRLDQIFVPVQYYDLNSTSSIATNYFAHAIPTPGPPTHPQGLEFSFPRLQDLLGDLLRNFGVVMRMDYDIANQRHLIQLIQRGRAYSTTLSFNSKVKSSQISLGTDLIGDAAQCEELTDNTKFCWFSKKYSDSPTTTAVPNYVQFDVDSRCIFKIDTGGTQAENNRQLYIWDEVSGHAPSLVTGIKYYNYATVAEVTASVTPSLRMQEAIAGYIYHRFTVQYAQIIQRYGQMKADDGTINDQTRLSILRRVSINDGVSTVVYYANKVRKYPKTVECEIEWIKE